jgi:hypothetical protein
VSAALFTHGLKRRACEKARAGFAAPSYMNIERTQHSARQGDIDAAGLLTKLIDIYFNQRPSPSTEFSLTT